MKLRVKHLFLNFFIPIVIIFVAGAMGSYVGLLSNVYATKSFVNDNFINKIELISHYTRNETLLSKYITSEEIEKQYLTKAESNIYQGNIKVLNSKVERIHQDILLILTKLQ